MKKGIVVSALISASLLTGCTSKEEKMMMEIQEKYLEQCLDLLDTQEEVLDQFKEEYQDEVKDIQNKTVPNLNGYTIDDLKNLYGEENIIYLDGIYLEECPECSGNYTCTEGNCWKYSHIQ